MAKPIPEIAADDLASRLDRGETLQILDVRAPDRVQRGRIELGPKLDFHNVPNSQLLGRSSPDTLGLDPQRPVAVVCGHGNSSRIATAHLRALGLDAYSLHGGMAAWETVYVPRPVAPTPSLDRVIQLDRVGKGALSYVLVSEGKAVVVDPGRHAEPYAAALADATVVAVIDTHMHADYLSGARMLSERWNVPYFVHPADAESPYDGTPGRIRYVPLPEGTTIRFGRAALRAMHTPGHTLGSVTLLSDDGLALTGDFVFVESLGRPDLGGQAAEWSRLLWQSVERARREWPADALVLPAHYAGESERRAGRVVAGRWDVIARANPGLAARDEAAFLLWVADNARTPPEIYRTIKLGNLGLVTISDADAEALESGPNVCAVGR
jgi:glyoxylase-like metal-dependent hydrolase (beta-lactamase superfamily II)